MEIDEDLVIPDRSKSILEGGIISLGESALKEDAWTYRILVSLSEKFKFDLNTPIEKLPEDILHKILYGLDGEKIEVDYKKDGELNTYSHKYEGIINNLRRRYMETNSDFIKKQIEQYMSDKNCPKCHGARLKDEVLAVTVGDKNIYEFSNMSIKDELTFIEELKLSEKNTIIASQILKEIKSRLQFLRDVGLDYLDLNRKAGKIGRAHV